VAPHVDALSIFCSPVLGSYIQSYLYAKDRKACSHANFVPRPFAFPLPQLLRQQQRYILSTSTVMDLIAFMVVHTTIGLMSRFAILLQTCALPPGHANMDTKYLDFIVGTARVGHCT